MQLADHAGHCNSLLCCCCFSTALLTKLLTVLYVEHDLVFCPAPLTPAQAVAVGVAKEGFSSAHCGLLFNAMTQSRPRSNSSSSSSSTGANSSGVGKRDDDGVVSSSNGAAATASATAAAATTDAAGDAANSKERAQRQRLMRWVRRGLGELRLDVFAYRTAQQQERSK
jgi:hypothetical protein